MKSIEKHHRDGTFEKSRHSDRVTTETPGSLKAPANLNKEQAKIFRDVAAKMLENKSLADLDRNALELYSIQFALMRKATAELESEGEVITVETKSGTMVIESPWVKILQKSSDLVMKLSAKLGLTPVDRNKATKVQEKEQKERSLLK